MIVFMAPDAPRVAVAAVERITRRSHRVDSYSYASQADAYRQFGKLFKNKDLLAGVTPSDLPPSFYIRLVDSSDRASVARQYRHLSGVKSVEVTPSCASVRRVAARIGFPKNLIHLNSCVSN